MYTDLILTDQYLKECNFMRRKVISWEAIIGTIVIGAEIIVFIHLIHTSPI